MMYPGNHHSLASHSESENKEAIIKIDIKLYGN